jgi:hypothetical protein
MVWSRTKLEQVARQRLDQRAKLAPVEKAALAYARWQGLTDEQDVDTDASKRALDAALDELDATGPEGWVGLERLAPELGDPAIIGLMQHSLRRSAEQVLGQAPPMTLEEGDEQMSSPKRRKKNDRDY